jgi:hypothetical protein
MTRHDHNASAVRFGRGALRNPGLGICLAALAVSAASPAYAQYEVGRVTIAGGAGLVAGGIYSLEGTIGQPEAGEMTGGSYVLGGGFWGGGPRPVVGIGDDIIVPTQLPLSFRLYAAAPNPLVHGTVISFDLPEPRFASIRVYDALGRRARTLVEETLPAGRHQRVWNGTDDAGMMVGVGIYFVRFEAEAFQARQKVIVLR